MEKHIIISSLNNLAAILHNGCLYKFVVNDHTYQLGNIYFGSIARVFPTIKSIFITIQINRKYQNGFIHVNDLLAIRNRNNSVIILKQKLCVQIIKEAFFGKNPRLTTHINIPGKYLIFSPVTKIMYISRKISNIADREYLKSFALLLRPYSSGGIFFKFQASQISDEIIIEEWQNLKSRWIIILKIMLCNTHEQSLLLYKDNNILKKVIRDLYNLQTQAIFIDRIEDRKKLRNYLKYWHRSTFNEELKIYILSLNHFLSNFQFHTVIAKTSKCRVELIPTGYIFIENFEALTLIDVNSGIIDKYQYPSGLVLILNCSAAKEIAYQIKIRNISGIIIIDFIDMTSKKDQLELLRYLHKLFKHDIISTQIVQFSELGLVEITRKRVGKSILEIWNNNQIYFSFIMKLPFLQDYLTTSIRLNKYSIYLVSKLFFNSVVHHSIYLKETSHPHRFLLNKRIEYSKTKYFINRVVQNFQFYLK